MILIIKFIEIFIMIVLIIVGIGFITLIERNIIGYSQFRKGPNKIGICGLIQSIIDGIKLILKDVWYIHKLNYFI